MRDKLSLLLSPPAQQSLSPVSGDLWRSLYFFNLYRLFLAVMLLTLATVLGDVLLLGVRDHDLFVRGGIAYLILVLAALPATRLRNPRFTVQLAFQVGADIVCLTVLAYASGGTQSNLGMLLLVSLMSWWYIFLKMFAIRQARNQSDAFEEAFWANPDLGKL